MSTQTIALDQIKPSSRNARTHSAKQIRQIANSMVAFGFTNPLLVNENGELIAGHGRYQAAILLGIEKVPVIVVAGLSPAKQHALAIADNKIAENAGWDRKRLAIEIPELADSLSVEGLDVSILGFESIEIDNLQTDFEAHVADPQDHVDPTWCAPFVVSKPGDLWVLDDHKLLCGNTRSAAEDITHLMTGCRADVAFLDPLASGEISSPDISRFLSITLDVAASVSREDAVHFLCMDRQHIAEFMTAAKNIYGEAVDLAVWVISKANQGAFYRGQLEFVGVFGVGKAPHHNIERGRYRRSRSNVWHYAEVNSLGAGAGTKPVALIADAIKDCTKKGDIVLDTFAGLGTTIMAAERVGRHARALEVKPRFVDLAIRRWQASTQRKALHAESGLSFDQIAADGAPSALAR